MSKTIVHNFLNVLAGVGLLSISTMSAAETWGPFAIIEPKPMSELWLNPGFYSYHFQKDKGFNNSNFGLGGEYRYSTVSSITLGGFYNSDRRTSNYAGWYWQPLTLGPVRLGAVVGVMDGYPRMNKGDWFPAAIPVASLEYKNIGANVILIPAYKDKLHGALSFQLKVKLY